MGFVVYLNENSKLKYVYVNGLWNAINAFGYGASGFTPNARLCLRTLINKVFLCKLKLRVSNIIWWRKWPDPVHRIEMRTIKKYSRLSKVLKTVMGVF